MFLYPKEFLRIFLKKEMRARLSACLFGEARDLLCEILLKLRLQERGRNPVQESHFLIAQKASVEACLLFCLRLKYSNLQPSLYYLWPR